MRWYRHAVALAGVTLAGSAWIAADARGPSQTASAPSAPPASQSAPPALVAVAGPAAEHQATIKRYCETCHNDRMKTAGLSLTGLDVARVAEHPEIWEKVLQKVQTRFMPPAGLPRPSEEVYASLTSYLE